MNIALYDFTPTYCPNCGYKTGIPTGDRYTRADYNASCSHSCPACGLKFAKVEDKHLIEAAKAAGSDLVNYL